MKLTFSLLAMTMIRIAVLEIMIILNLTTIETDCLVCVENPSQNIAIYSGYAYRIFFLRIEHPNVKKL